MLSQALSFWGVTHTVSSKASGVHGDDKTRSWLQIAQRNFYFLSKEL